jgi:hypothetical protein
LFNTLVKSDNAESRIEMPWFVNDVVPAVVTTDSVTAGVVTFVSAYAPAEAEIAVPATEPTP